MLFVVAASVVSLFLLLCTCLHIISCTRLRQCAVLLGAMMLLFLPHAPRSRCRNARMLSAVAVPQTRRRRRGASTRRGWR